MPSDMYIKFPDPIKGESEAANHTGEIEVQSYSWGSSNPVVLEGKGLAGGKVSISSFNFMMQHCDASPRLFAANCSGQHFATVIFTANRATGEGGQSKYQVITLGDVMIESYQTSGSNGGGLPMESVSLAFKTIKYEYFPQADADGKTSTGASTTWDLSKVTK